VANVVIDPTAAATRLAVDRFYAAINVLLAAGDTAPLDAAVDPTFVDHVAASQERDRPAFITDLLAPRRAGPGRQLVVDGDQALAYLPTDPFDTAETSSTTTIEALRVRGGVVVARWRDRLETTTAVHTPAPAERWSGDAVWAVPAVPTAEAAPRRYPRTQK
jgi:hypothetical protein